MYFFAIKNLYVCQNSLFIVKKIFHKWHILIFTVGYHIFKNSLRLFFTYCFNIWFWNCKKIILNLLDSKNFASNSFNVYLTTSFGTNYHVTCLWNLSNSLIDFWLLTFDFWLSIYIYFSMFTIPTTETVSRLQGYHCSIMKFTFCSINAKIYFQIIFCSLLKRIKSKLFIPKWFQKNICNISYSINDKFKIPFFSPSCFEFNTNKKKHVCNSIFSK